MAEHINIRLKYGRGISKNVCDLGFKSAGNLVGSCALPVDRRHRMCIDRCLSLNVDLQTGSMVSYGLLVILSPKYTKITTFLQNIHEPVNILKKLQNIINSS